MSYKLFAQFPLQPVCQQRQYSALLKWAAFIEATSISAQPSISEVQQRIVAALIPIQTQNYVIKTIGYTIQSPDVETNINEQLNAFNRPEVEVAMEANVEAAVSAAMPRFCATDVTEAQVSEWYLDHGIPEPEAAPA
jgi:hypothetical protein